MANANKKGDEFTTANGQGGSAAAGVGNRMDVPEGAAVLTDVSGSQVAAAAAGATNSA